MSNIHSMKKKNKFLVSILVLVLLGFIAVGVYEKFYNPYRHLSPTVQQIIKEKTGGSEKESPLTPSVQYDNQLPFYRQQYGNPYIIAHLKIDSVKIDSLVSRAANNEYYLNHNLYNAYDELGSAFVDHRNQNLTSDRQINIYGHNTQNSKYYDVLPFTNLEAYTDINIFDHYKNVVLDIDERQLLFEVIAVKIVTDNDFEHMKLVFYSDEDWLQHVNKLLSNTLYIDDGNSKVGVSDRLLVLQACHYNPMNSYLLVICKEVR